MSPLDQAMLDFCQGTRQEYQSVLEKTEKLTDLAKGLAKSMIQTELGDRLSVKKGEEIIARRWRPILVRYFKEAGDKLHYKSDEFLRVCEWMAQIDKSGGKGFKVDPVKMFSHPTKELSLTEAQSLAKACEERGVEQLKIKSMKVSDEALATLASAVKKVKVS